jgi:hypothetical protein
MRRKGPHEPDKQMTPIRIISPRAAVAVLIACTVTILLFVIHPRLGVRDVDGYAYIMGARSLHLGHGYRSLTGETFNHWPPGYSLFLSVFSGSLVAAQVINYLAAGIAAGFLYFLLRQSEWSWQAACGLVVTLSAGFFRLMASAVHADVLTYAIFLVAICSVARRPESKKLLASLLWAVLIPVKLIAVVFIPPAAVADIVASGEKSKLLFRGYLIPAIAAIVGTTSVLVFNHITIQAWIPGSHGHSTLRTLSADMRMFVVSIPRELLFGWHGSVAASFPRFAFPICLILAAICICSLRPNPRRRWLIVYAVSCLACSALLLAVRHYDTSVRLVGYGLLVLLAGLRPAKWANLSWLLYGVASLVTGLANAMLVNSLGSADPRYSYLAAEVKPYYQGTGPVATNSFHILDLYANIPSEPVTNWGEAAQYETFLWVTLPSFDPGASPVTPMEHPGTDWCEKQHFQGAVLFYRCAGPAPR